MSLSALGVCTQLIMAGLPGLLLLRLTNASWTLVIYMLLVFCLALSGRAGGEGSISFAVLSAALFAIAFLRTRAIWLPLGLQLGWTLAQQLLFGRMPPYAPASGGLVQSETGGAQWLTGSVYGPETSLVALITIMAALIVLIRVTRDYAWHYTFERLEGAGYPVEIKPPAAHEREQARQAEPLVQIAGAGQAQRVTPPESSQ